MVNIGRRQFLVRRHSSCISWQVQPHLNTTSIPNYCADLMFRNIPNYCADLGNGPNYRFLLDFTATEEVPSLGYLFLRAVNIFYALPLPDPLVFLGVRYRKTILAVGGHHQPHNSSSSVL